MMMVIGRLGICFPVEGMGVGNDLPVSKQMGVGENSFVGNNYKQNTNQEQGNTVHENISQILFHAIAKVRIKTG